MSERVAVCISTFHRAEGLRRVLDSVAEQELPEPAPIVSIVVVNNDPDDPRPQEIINSLGESFRFPIELLHEPKRGLSHPRNAAIEHTIDAYDLIAYIDDDSTAAPTWLGELLAVQRQTGSDIVTGPVAPAFESPSPDWIVAGGFFARWDLPTGSARRYAHTNNVLIRTEVLRRTGVRFAPELALMGGEDTHFTRSLHRMGASIVWANDAVVNDAVPAERATARWLIRRHERAGMTIVWIERDFRGRIVTYPVLIAKAAAWTLLGTALWCAGVVTGRAKRVRARCWIAWGRGIFLGLFGRSRLEYLEER